MTLLEVKNLKKIYTTRHAKQQVKALSNVTFSIEEGEYVAIMGESGSGKTTLLNILAALDKPTSGEVLLDGKGITQIKDKKLSQFRRDNLGFVFQDFNLLDTFSNKDNILLPLVLSNESYPYMKQKLKELAPKLGIENILEQYPYEVSGGQKQRVAVARALITHPKLLLADEPTGALDSASSTQLLQILKQMNQEGQTILMVTHSVQAACYAKRVLFIKDGQLFHQIYKGDQTNEQMYQSISDTLTLLASRKDNSYENIILS
ncbi:MAG: ABC transporter ATP-binding protein [Erysipelotrichaceae bacterium]|nr:ABC transporter ATP-binding protein [Erysipelotrichaceae bacterium]